MSESPNTVAIPQVMMGVQSGQMWHIECRNPYARHSPMNELRDEPEHHRTLFKCVACELTGYYPHGANGRARWCDEGPNFRRRPLADAVDDVFASVREAERQGYRP